MRFTVWTKRQVLLCLALLMALNTLATACTVLWVCHVRYARHSNTPVLCMEDEANEAVAVMAVASEALFEVQAVEPTQTNDEKPEEESTETIRAETTATPTAQEDRAFRVEVVHASPEPKTQGKRILIYHTHTWEAFEQVKGARYQETEKWRSKDNSVNMVAVGDALTASLRAMGFDVVHDSTAFEPPNLSDSYQRSLSMLEKRAANGETYDLYIDLHRDAFSSANAIKRCVNVGGEALARIMVLVGKGEGYEQKPDWQANLLIAQRITDGLNEQVTDLGRDVKIKTGRFNQHIAPKCVLIECGCNYNTLQEVLCSMPYLAQAICSALTEENGDE